MTGLIQHSSNVEVIWQELEDPKEDGLEPSDLRKDHYFPGGGPLGRPDQKAGENVEIMYSVDPKFDDEAVGLMVKQPNGLEEERAVEELARMGLALNRIFRRMDLYPSPDIVETRTQVYDKPSLDMLKNGDYRRIRERWLE